MTKLNQLIAVTNGQKGRTQKSETEVYHKFQKAALFSGISRKYRPKDEEGETFPSESKKVICRVRDLIEEASVALIRLIDLVATIDRANCAASASVALGETQSLNAVPVTTLLFLEKRLVDLHTFIESIPTLDPSEDWKFSRGADCFATPTTEKNKTKKVPKAFVKYAATKEHPAQVDTFTEDVVTGTWETISFSGALPESEKAEMLYRVKQLQDGIKTAREEANNLEVTDENIGKRICEYIFGERPQS